eukprot:1186964-Prorocentrum_minimum.AAC.3
MVAFPATVAPPFPPGGGELTLTRRVSPVQPPKPVVHIEATCNRHSLHLRTYEGTAYEGPSALLEGS